MNTQEIYDLLDKYYRGESSDEEERVLRDFFSEGIIPPDLETEKEIFDHFAASAGVPAPSADFESRIISALDMERRKEPASSIRRSLLTVISSAASILIILGIYFMLSERSRPEDTYSDPALAYAETIKILYNVSAGLNSGMDALEPVRKLESATARTIETISKSTGMIESNLRSLDHFRKAISIANSPLQPVNK